MPRTTRSPLHRAGSHLVARTFVRLLATQQLARRDQFVATGTPPGRVVFLGDSISEFGNWDEWFPGLPVLNRGIGGETSAQVLTRLDSAINAPVLVLLLIGTNDLTAGVAPSDIAANVEQILDDIERRAPGTRVVLQSVMPRTSAYRAELQSVNRRYRAIAQKQPDRTLYVDLWPELSTEAGALRPGFTRDRLHLNGSGYAAWVSRLRPLFAELLPDVGDTRASSAR